MKEVKESWRNAWDNIVSIDQVYRSYGVRSVMKCFHSLLLDEEKTSLLDVGCGAGFYFKFFNDMGFKELWGLEYDEGNVKKAKELNKSLGVKLLQGDIKKLPYPFEENYFGIIVSLGLIEHFVYPVDIIRKLLRILKKNGTLILEMPNFRNWFYYSYNLKRKDKLPFHLWWGVKEWYSVLTRIKGCKLEEVRTGDFWAYRAYLPRGLNKISSKLVDIEISIENRLFKKSGSLAFYKLRKL